MRLRDAFFGNGANDDGADDGADDDGANGTSTSGDSLAPQRQPPRSSPMPDSGSVESSAPDRVAWRDALGDRTRPLRPLITVWWHHAWDWLRANTRNPSWLPCWSSRRRPPGTVIILLVVALIELIVCAAVVGFQQLYPTFRFPEAILLLAITVVALSWGSGPGVLATAITAAGVAGVLFVPGSRLALRNEEDLAGVGLLLLMGCVICYLAAQLDRQRMRAERASAQMEAFLHIVSHELRTPLTSLRLTISLTNRRLQRMNMRGIPTTPEGTGMKQASDLLTNADHQIERLSRLINDLVDAARIQSGKLQLQLGPCDLTALLHETVSAQRQTLQPHPLRVRLPPTPVTVRADADRIEQVISNYLSNAGKYSPPDSPVTLLLRIRDRYAVVAVRDHGPGLTPEQQQRIWRQGERLAEVPVQSGEGANLGLGLYLCRAIIEDHGGQIGVMSRPGRGATFWFSLPLHA